ncbi:hypothetical protein, partial [Listeria monocytogenes]
GLIEWGAGESFPCWVWAKPKVLFFLCSFAEQVGTNLYLNASQSFFIVMTERSELSQYRKGYFHKVTNSDML